MGGSSFRLPHDFLQSTLLYRIHFSWPVISCFKNRTVLLHLIRDSHVEIPARRVVLGLFGLFFFCVTYVEPKHQSYEHNHKFFPMFDLDILSMSSYLRVVQHWLFSMSPFDRYQLQLVYLTVEGLIQWEIFSMKLQTTSEMFSQSEHLLHTLHNSCISVDKIKHNMPENVAFFLSSSLLKWLHRNSPILLSFFFNAYCYDSCHNTIWQNCF